MLSRNRRIGGDEGEEAHNQREFFHAYLHTLDVERAGLPTSFKDKLRRALGHYGVHDLDLTPQLEESLYWMYLAQRRTSLQLPAVIAILRQLDRPDYVPLVLHDQFLDTLDRLIVATQLRYPVVGDLARSVRFRYFDQPLITANRERVTSNMRNTLAAMADPERESSHDEGMRLLVECPVPLIELMVEFDHDEDATKLHLLIEVLTRRYYQIRALDEVSAFTGEGRRFVTGNFRGEQGAVKVVACALTDRELADADFALGSVAAEAAGSSAGVVDLYVRWTSSPDEGMVDLITSNVAGFAWPASVYRVTVSTTAGGTGIHRFTFVRGDNGLSENRVLRNLHPMIAERLQLWRLARFDLTRLPSPDHVYLFRCVGRDRPTDERLVVLAEVRDLDPLFDASGSIAALPELERVLASCLDAIRRVQAERPPNRRLSLNRVLLYVWPTIDVPFGELVSMIRTLAPTTEGLGLEEVSLEGRAASPADGQLRNVVVRVSRPLGGKLDIAVSDPATAPIQPLDAYGQKVAQARQRGTVYPFELIPLLVRHDDGPLGTFVELDLDEEGRLVPVGRAYGQNAAALIVGIVSTPTARYPAGMTRMALFSDPTKALGSVAEPECRRIVAALDRATEMQIPVEWFAVSSGAKISMESGTENMDWVSRALRRIVEFTQAGGEVNVVVAGINVGAQPYWNAEATMLMHTRGILIMTPDSAMVLTGKQALEYSGGVAADDNFGIGGYDTVMGPNGQAQYWAPHLDGAIDTLFAHYEHTYVAPGERFPRAAQTSDPDDRDVRLSAQDIDGVEFGTVGDIFADETNPERKKPFDIRTLMRAAIDQDHPPLERWAEMDGAETTVVFDAFIGGQSACVLGIESRPLVRRGLLPPDGPNQWFASTLYPRSSKKLARAINAASGNRPLIVLANLSGFDGSPESLRTLQLEYGAEIGRAIVNFDGPIVFCVVSRYHGGAFVVFSATLNDSMEVVAIEGSYASVIGGPPAAAVVFTGEVNAQTAADPRIRQLEQRIIEAEETDAPRLRVELERLRASVRTEKLGEVAEQFERIHSIERAREVGSIHQIIPAWELRPYLVEAVGRGINRTLSGLADRDADGV
jgi:acetyl-CoA carboxylase carboxyltransferase component